MVCFFIGRFTVPAHQSLRTTQSRGRLRVHLLLHCADLAFAGGHVGLIARLYAAAFMLIQYPTIFSLGVKNLGQATPNTVLSFHRYDHHWRRIVTPVMGFVSYAAGNIPTAELIPALCFAVIFDLSPVSVLKRQLT